MGCVSSQREAHLEWPREVKQFEDHMPFHGSPMLKKNCATSHLQRRTNGDSCNQYRANSIAGDTSPKNIARVGRSIADLKKNTKTCGQPCFNVLHCASLANDCHSLQQLISDTIQTRTRREEGGCLPAYWHLIVRSSADGIAISSSDGGSPYFEHCTKHFRDAKCMCCFASAMLWHSARQSRQSVPWIAQNGASTPRALDGMRAQCMSRRKPTTTLIETMCHPRIIRVLHVGSSGSLSQEERWFAIIHMSLPDIRRPFRTVETVLLAWIGEFWDLVGNPSTVFCRCFPTSLLCVRMWLPFVVKDRCGNERRHAQCQWQALVSLFDGCATIHCRKGAEMQHFLRRMSDEMATCCACENDWFPESRRHCGQMRMLTSQKECHWEVQC